MYMARPRLDWSETGKGYYCLCNSKSQEVDGHQHCGIQVLRWRPLGISFCHVWTVSQMAVGSTHISKLTTRCWSPWQEQQKERELILLTRPSYILGLTPIELTWVSSPWLNQLLCQGEKIFSYTSITCPSQITGSGCKSSSDYQSDCGYSNPKERNMLH